MIPKLSAKLGIVDFTQDELDIANDEDVPPPLRDSLISQSSDPDDIIQSEEIEQVQESSVIQLEVSSLLKQTMNEHEKEEIEESWEAARDCPLDCTHNDCPFQQPKIESCTCIVIRSKSSLSTTSLVQKVSSMSLIPKASSRTIIELNDNDQDAFVLITRLVPLRDNGVVVHWKVQSAQDVRGFKVRSQSPQFSSITNFKSSSGLHRWITRWNLFGVQAIRFD